MIIIKILWLLLPAGISNMSAAISAKLFPKLNAPVDFKKTFRGRRILGDHKTIRGLIFGSILGSIIFFIQIYLYSNFESIRDISIINYDEAYILTGLIMGFGALFGDMVKSFLKRQMDFKPGQSWYGFDQIDWLFGSLILSWPFTQISFLHFILALIIGVLSHMFVKFVGYLLKLDKEPI